jgi:hypothetical protein
MNHEILNIFNHLTSHLKLVAPQLIPISEQSFKIKAHGTDLYPKLDGNTRKINDDIIELNSLFKCIDCYTINDEDKLDVIELLFSSEINDLSIPNEFKKNGYTFKLHSSERTNFESSNTQFKCIYVGLAESHMNVEVVILKEGPHHPMSGLTGTKLHYPSSELWGIRGWTFRSLEKAIEKYNEL